MNIEYLRENLEYLPDSGKFIWIKAGKKRKLGEEAGSVLSNGYKSIMLLGKRYYLHRLAWFYCFEEWPTLLDHINRIKTDNSLDNLREVTQSTNMHNTIKYVNNTSGYKGVFLTSSGKFKSQIYINKKLVYLGTFINAIDASNAYIEASNTLPTE